MPITWYDSIKAFADSLPEQARGNISERERWSGNQTYREAKSNLWRGDSESLDISDKLLEQIEGQGIELAQAAWEESRTGFIPCVPAYLAGSPDAMLKLSEIRSENTPIKIFVDVCLSAGFTQEMLVKRGTAILALARKLQNIRPVELYLIATMNGREDEDHKDGYGACAIPVIRLETNPLDLTTASYAMANAAFLRRLCFAWGYDNRGFTGAWAWFGSPSKNREKLIKFLGVGEQDLLIDGAYMTDELMRDPLQWVNAQVKKYTNFIEDAAS